MVAAEGHWASQIARVDEKNLASAMNLAHYATLDDILRRMAGQHDKKNALLRPLHSWQLTATPATVDPIPPAAH